MAEVQKQIPGVDADYEKYKAVMAARKSFLEKLTPMITELMKVVGEKDPVVRSMWRFVNNWVKQ